MKSSDKPQFSKTWWTSEKPSEIKGAELEQALANAEKTLADEKKQSNEKSVEACRGALDELSDAVDKTIKKELDKKKHKDCIAVLEKFDGLINGELKRIDGAQNAAGKSAHDGDGAEEDEESEGKLFDKDQLDKMVKLLRSGAKELNFGFGLNTKTPESSQFILSRKGKADKLFRALKNTGNYSNRCLAFGKAMADTNDGKTLVFVLDSGSDEPPQIIKLGRRFLRADKDLKFRKLKVVGAGGNPLVDDEPDDDDAASDGQDQSIPAEEMERIRKELGDMDRRLEELFNEHVVSA